MVGINTDALRQLQDRAARMAVRNAELAAQLREYATGVRKGVDLEDGQRYVYSDGGLHIDTRRSAARFSTAPSSRASTLTSSLSASKVCP